MFTKKLFGVAGAALLMVSGAATAQVNLSDTDATPIKYASELVVPTTGLELKHPGIRMDAPFRIRAQDYVRIELDGAKFGSDALALHALEDDDTLSDSRTDIYAGGSGEDFIVFTNVTADSDGGVQLSGSTATDTITLMVTSKGPVTATIGIYADRASALRRGDDPIESEQGTVAMFAPSIKVTATQMNQTIDSASDFLKFKGIAQDVSATLGSLAITLNKDIKDATHITITTFGTLLAPAAGTLTVTGDFSLTEDEKGNQQSGYATYRGGAGALAGTFAEDGGSIEYSLGAIASGVTADNGIFELTAGGHSPIEPSTYEYELKLTPLSDAIDLSGVANLTGNFGEIKRDGTTVDIPYITTFDGYNQRLILTNKGSRDADYTVTFRTEGNVTATADTHARGTVPAGEVLVIRMTDLVTLEGRTRAAGEINFVGVSSDSVTVATTIVNQDGGGTDTVVLN